MVREKGKVLKQKLVRRKERLGRGGGGAQVGGGGIARRRRTSYHSWVMGALRNEILVTGNGSSSRLKTRSSLILEGTRMSKQDFFRRCRACSAYLDDKSEDRE